MKEIIKALIRKVKLARGSIGAKKTLFDETPSAYRGENNDYQKFIVFAHQRSGSSMVVGTLRNNPKILSFGEIFNKSRITYNVGGYDNNSLKMQYLREKYPITFLNRNIFSSYNNDIQAVGFKLFPRHLDNNKFSSVWDWISKNKDVKIIFLTRKNLLATYTSLLIAKKTGKFSIRHESERTEEQVEIDIEECLAYFNERERYHLQALDRLKNNLLLEISYEEMILDLGEAFKKIQQFLAIDYFPIKPNTLKKEVRPLSQVISNYSQLKNELMNTKWRAFFDE